MNITFLKKFAMMAAVAALAVKDGEVCLRQAEAINVLSESLLGLGSVS